MPKNKNSPDYQLDLTPFISLLSVCICFLLLTVAWFQIGALTVRQVIGAEQSGEPDKNRISLWIYMKNQKSIEIQLKKDSKGFSKKQINIRRKQSAYDFKEFKKHIQNLKKQQANIGEALIFPEGQDNYEDIMKIMDSLRQEGIFNMGLSPI